MHTVKPSPTVRAIHAKIFIILIVFGGIGSARCFSSSPLAIKASYSAGLSFFISSSDTRPVNITVSIGNFSGLKCVLKKWTVNMNPTAKSASSLCTIVATLTSHPGRKCVNNSGNHSINPDEPIIVMPQNTAK